MNDWNVPFLFFFFFGGLIGNHHIIIITKIQHVGNVKFAHVKWIVIHELPT